MVKPPPQRASALNLFLLSPATLAAVLINTQGCTRYEELKSSFVKRLLHAVKFATLLNAPCTHVPAPPNGSLPHRRTSESSKLFL